MELILVRHGNTFESGERVYWVGCQQDLPLTAFGVTQALPLVNTLKKMHLIPQVYYAGSLQRLTVFANEMMRLFDRDVTQLHIDKRLNEIDYGQWGGLTRQEIETRFGQTVLERWEKKAIWPLPSEGHWGESEDRMIARIQTFLNELIHQYLDQVILVVTSHGCLRYFLEVMPTEKHKKINENTLKVATGHFCWMTYHDQRWSLKRWNHV